MAVSSFSLGTDSIMQESKGLTSTSHEVDENDVTKGTKNDKCGSVPATSTKNNSNNQATVAKEHQAQQLSHAEVKEVCQKALTQLLKQDPILKDLHPDINYQEVGVYFEIRDKMSVVVFLIHGYIKLD